MKELHFPSGPIEHALLRLERLRSLCDAMLKGDLPFKSTEIALKDIRTYITTYITNIKRLRGERGDSIYNKISNANISIHYTLIALGLLMRSTNPRNSYECYFSLEKLCKDALGGDHRLIFSTEWNYSPLTYPLIFEGLEQFVFLGFPVTEANNILLLPISGHEIGHTVWKSADYDNIMINFVRNEISQHMGTIKAQHDIENYILADRCRQFVLSQCQEVFCDIYGTLIFGDSYAYAFESYIAPGIAKRGSLTYPHTSVRAKFIAHVLSEQFSIDSRSYAAQFAGLDEMSQSRPREEDISDRVMDVCFQQVCRLALESYNSSGLNFANEDIVTNVGISFSRGLPYAGDATMPEVLVAAWRQANDIEQNRKYSIKKKIEEKQNLNEMAYKTLEFIELQHR